MTTSHQNMQRTHKFSLLTGQLAIFDVPFSSALFHLYRERGRRQFWAQARSEGGGSAAADVTTERRSISPKVSRPRGLKRRGPIGGVARRSRPPWRMLPPHALPLGPQRFQPRS
jgi:hypothetical protein